MDAPPSFLSLLASPSFLIRDTVGDGAVFISLVGVAVLFAALARITVTTLAFAGVAQEG